MFRKGDPVEKFGGDYGGPGVVVGCDVDESGPWYAVSFKIEGGFGTFKHFLRAEQLRPLRAPRQPPVRDLRDLARQLRKVAEEHFCYGQACNVIAVMEDHLTAMARIVELNKTDAARHDGR